MKRKYFALILVAALVIAFAVPAMAFADNGNHYGNGNGNGNAYGWYNGNGNGNGGALNPEHGNCNNPSAYNKLERMVSRANAKIEALVSYAQSTPEDDVDWLIEETNAVAAEVVAYAESIGATVECSYTTYYVDGQYVEIDPLRVVDLGGGTKHTNA